MTRKDYARIAAVIADMPRHAPLLRTARERAARALACAFAADDPRFDSDKFLAACDPSYATHVYGIQI